MRVTVLSFEDLRHICEDLVNKARSYSVPFWPVLKVQMDTGLRINEVYELSRWRRLDNGFYSVQLEKGSGLRIIDTSGLPIEFNSILERYPDTGFFFRTRQINYFISGNSGYDKLKVGGKEVCTHLFRYYYVKSLHQQGWTDEQIRAQIVHSSPSVTAQYIYGNITGYQKK